MRVHGTFTVNDIILAGEAARQFEDEGVDPYTAHVAAHAIASAMVVSIALGLAENMERLTRNRRIILLKSTALYMLQGGTVEGLTETMRGVVREVMAHVIDADNPDTATSGGSPPGDPPETIVYPLDDENIMVVEPTYGNITIIEISPP